MTPRMLCAPVLWSCLVSVGQAQVITGSGTTNTIPQFTSATTIGNSPIVQFDGRIGIGVPLPGMQLHVKSTRTANPLNLPGVPAAIYAEFNGAFGAGILGLADGGDGVSGVHGIVFSPPGVGVAGNHAVNGDGGGGGGVIGITGATRGFAYGIRGDANGTTGGAIGVMGVSMSPEGDAGRFYGVANESGTILRGQAGPPGTGEERTVFRVDGTGRVFANGGFRPFGADFAELLPVIGTRADYAPGDLLVIDRLGERRLALSDTPYSTLVAGIYSTNPGVVASQHRMNDPALDNEVPLAILGIVSCKVTAENGPIAVGDLLVTSSMPGRAMKGTDRTRMLGAVVGKALEPLREGTGVIQVLVTLQ